jgi:5-methylcytosine-specific restriction protein B
MAYDPKHFELLTEWRGRPYDKNDPTGFDINEQLMAAYNVTKNWGAAVANRLFGTAGQEKTIRRTYGHWNRRFDQYQWSRIYPSHSAPRQLAYTVGIDADDGFYVKLDLIDNQVEGPQLRQKFDSIAQSATISATMPRQAGLNMTLAELVEWSVGEIAKFEKTYDDVLNYLDLTALNARQNLLQHFRGHSHFVKRQPKWPPETTALFCQLADTVHEAGLDWWYTKSTNSQLRFGRKLGQGDGSPIGWIFLAQNGVHMTWAEPGSHNPLQREPLSDETISSLEKALEAEQESWAEKLTAPSDHPGYWPDYYQTVEATNIDDDDGIAIETPTEGARVTGADVPPRNIIYYGPPGTGKTFKLQQQLNRDYSDEHGERYAFVTFHQSYGYEEFVEGLRPVLIEPDAPGEPARAREVGYEIKRGAFLSLCARARENSTQRYAMVIDEINRGNISKIFGELITLVEIDKREGGKHPISLTLPYSSDRFSVPWNVDIIRTMNTADRSLALVDTALRRRFEFIETMPDPSVLKDVIVRISGVEIDVQEMLTVINRRVESLYDRDHTIGHAYFTQLRNLTAHQQFPELQAIFKNRIIPLLEEYFFEDWQKIRLVLGDNQKSSLDYQFVREASKQDEALSLFGSNSQMDQYQFRPRYHLYAPALGQANAYIEIYSRTSAVVDDGE